MDGIAYLKDYCQKKNIDLDKTFKFGRGTNGTKEDKKNRHRKRYKLTLGNSTTNDPQLYAIQYCKDIDVYIAWKYEGQHILSIKADDIILPLGKKICPVKKHKEYSGWGEELVLYFQKEGIPDFLERYILKGKESLL